MLAVLPALAMASSPRPWRCFLAKRALPKRGRVFSTSVEVFPSLGKWPTLTIGLLHVRGGVSYWDNPYFPEVLSSPRPWRCFFFSQVPNIKGSVFSTSVEVFPS